MKNNLVNIPGWLTNRKIVVFESDDWGSIRMPSQKAFSHLLAKGIPVDQSRYDSLYSLEKRKDIESLVETLSKFQDKDKVPPVFTTNMVMGNPDFQKIEKTGFEAFYHQFFLDSYQDYYGEDKRETWESAIKNVFF